MSTLSRRTLLALGATTVTASFAGCSGEPEDDDGEQTTPEPTTTESFAIEHLRLCSERPGGYREYTEQPDSTYEPGDVVWIYLEPTPVGTESADAGEVSFSFDATWTVTDPAGEEMATLSDTISRTVSESADLSTVYLTLDVSPSQEFEAGTYEVDIEIEDTIAGTSATETLEFTVESAVEQAEGTFSIPEIVFTDGEATDYQDYTEQPNAEYGPNDTVWYYYEIPGVHYEETDDKLVLDLSIFETLTGPEGDVWSEADIPLTNEFDPDIDLSTYHVVDHLAPAEEWLTGEYTLALEVTDGYTGETIEKEGTFTVVE